MNNYSSGLLLLGKQTVPRASVALLGNKVAPAIRRVEDVDDVSIAATGIGFLGGGLLLMSLWSKHPVWGFVLGSILGTHAATLVSAGITSVKESRS